MAKTRIREYGDEASQRFTLHLTASQMRAVKRLADKQGQTQAAVVRFAVVQYLQSTSNK